MMRINLFIRLVLLFVLLGLFPFILMGSYAYFKSDTMGRERINNRLQLIRESKNNHLSDYIEHIRQQLVTYAQVHRSFTQATVEFQAALSDLQRDFGPTYEANHGDIDDRLKVFYSQHQKRTPGTQEDVLERWWPRDKITLALQHLYVSSNPYPTGEKYKLDRALQDRTRYGEVHARFHPMMREIAQRFDIYDILLIEPQEGRVVYSEAKELDLGSPLFNGPYQNSGLAKMVAEVIASPKAGQVYFSDFLPYEPSQNEITGFIGTPLFEQEKFVGILVLQIPLGYIGQIMTEKGKWKENGFGRTGEVLLIAHEQHVLNETREFLTQPDVFFKTLEARGTSPEVLARMRQHNSVIGKLYFRSDAVEKALKGETGVQADQDYFGRTVLVAYRPFDFLGKRLAMVAMMQKHEALELSEDLFEAMLVLGVLIGAAVLSVSWLFARSLSRPLLRTINNLSASSSEIAATITQQERIISQQATSVTETNTTMEELGASARQSAEQAANAAHNMQAVLGVAQEGVTKMETMTHAMDDLKAKVGAIAQQILHLSEQTSQIGSITEMVTVFANETKMLAMNAAVEAVRAGEHGKGFSVLSVEIRKLADESKRSADRIKSLVSDVQQATNTTVMVTEEGTKTVESSRILVKDTMETFNRVSNLINFAHENTQQISLNVRQQAEAVRQVLEAMNALSISAKETATGIGQTKIGIQTLNTAAQELKAMM